MPKPKTNSSGMHLGAQASMPLARLLAPTFMHAPDEPVSGGASPSDPTPPPEPEPSPESEPPLASAVDGDAPDTRRQEAEQRLKRQNDTLRAELEELRRTQMNEQERAVTDAKAAGRAEALTEAGKRIAAADIRAALTSVVPDPAAVVDDLDLGKFLTDAGEVDMAKISDLRAKYQAFAPTAVRQPTPDPQGGGVPTPTIDDQIAAAQAAGDTKRVIQLNSQKLAELAGIK